MTEEPDESHEFMWYTADGIIALVSLKTFSENISHYKKLAELSHIFLDELLWLPHYSPCNDFQIPSGGNYMTFEVIKFLKSLENNLERYLWIAPHLYVILTCSISHYDIGEVLHFERFVRESSLHKTMLTSTMRMTKQVHDFIVQKEWQDFEYKLAENKFFSVLSICCGDNITFSSVLCSSHGHHISGPPVRIFNVNCSVTNPLDEEVFEKFLSVSVQVTLSEVERHYKVNIKPKHMAVIVDTCTTNHIRIKHELLHRLSLMLENNKEERYEFSSLGDRKFEEHDNIVAVCNSDDIASFEWSVVIHIKYIYDHNYRFGYSSKTLTYFDSYHNMIASRCTVQYIIICCKDAEDAWPHTKSFQNFKLWCKDNNKRPDTTAYQEYLKL